LALIHKRRLLVDEVKMKEGTEMGNREDYCQLIVDTARELSAKRFLSATGGNLSVRIPGEGAFAITPSDYDYLKMESKDICVLGADLIVQGGTRKPSVESGMHAAIYQARPDVNAIIHTHQVYPSTLALIGKPIPALFDEQVRFLGRSVEIIPYAPSGTGELAKTVANRVKGGDNAFIMANHGALLFGTDMERAVHNVAVLEKCALAYLLALCSGTEASTIPQAACEVAFARLREDQQKYEK
jgi:L-ribulose-5-phosphate 4-epimerase